MQDVDSLVIASKVERHEEDSSLRASFSVSVCLFADLV
jgi:hypothetical protein